MSNMVEAYRGFFAASAGASAAFIGLLFVALAFIDSEKVEDAAKAWRRIIASSAFIQLIDIFFVSIIGLLPDPRNLAVAAIAMSLIGIMVAIRLLPATIDSRQTGRTTPSLLGLIAVAAYGLQLGAGVKLLHSPNNQTALSYLIVAIIGLYAGALARAWELTGIKGSN